MGILSIVLLIFFVVVALLLVLMVIIQDSDSDSLGGLFAGGSSSAFGSRSTSVVVRFTYILGALFFVVAFGLAVLNKSSVGNVEAAAQQKTEATPTEWWNVQPKSPSPDLQAQTTAPTAPAVPAPTSGK